MQNGLERLMALAALLCAACGASADVHSVRDPSYTGKIRSVYLAVGQGGISEDYANGFVESCARELKSRGIRFTSRVITGLELDRNLLEHDIAAAQTDAALVVVPVRGAAWYGEITNLTWEVSLFDAKTHAKVWRAKVENKKAGGAYGTTSGMVDEAAVEIIHQLESDHMFGSGS